MDQGHFKPWDHDIMVDTTDDSQGLLRVNKLKNYTVWLTEMSG